MEGEFQDQGQLDQYLEEWLSPRGSKSVHGFFSEEENQESIRMEDSAPEGAMISNKTPEEEAKGGDDSQNNDFISLSCFELLE